MTDTPTPSQAQGREALVDAVAALDVMMKLMRKASGLLRDAGRTQDASNVEGWAGNGSAAWRRGTDILAAGWTRRHPGAEGEALQEAIKELTEQCRVARLDRANDIAQSAEADDGERPEDWPLAIEAPVFMVETILATLTQHPKWTGREELVSAWPGGPFVAAHPTAPADAQGNAALRKRLLTYASDRHCVLVHVDLASDLRSAAQAASVAESGLRPMSEAPRDGSFILSHNRHGVIDTILWNKHEQAWDDGLGYREFEPFATYEPPGWLPVPAALSAATALSANALPFEDRTVATSPSAGKAETPSARRDHADG